MKISKKVYISCRTEYTEDNLQKLKKLGITTPDGGLDIVDRPGYIPSFLVLFNFKLAVPSWHRGGELLEKQPYIPMELLEQALVVPDTEARSLLLNEIVKELKQS